MNSEPEQLLHDEDGMLSCVFAGVDESLQHLERSDEYFHTAGDVALHAELIA